MPADKRLPVHEETKQLLEEHKPDGMTWDLWVRRDPRIGGERDGE